MKLIEAVQIAKQRPSETATPFTVSLACGFNPLHFETFLKAHLQLALPAYAVAVETGLYSGLLESIEKLKATNSQQIVVIMEWPDLDLRLGLRHLGGWTPSVLADIMAAADERLSHLLALLEATRTPVALVLPTLPLPPAAFAATAESSAFDLQLRQLIGKFAVAAARPSSIILNSETLNRRSPPSERHDVTSELQTGFPYSRSHADTLSQMLVRVIAPPPPKKGLITDLDDTLWLGLIGDDGLEGISWDLDHQSQMHGAYQQLLGSLSGSGVLLAIASKNDTTLVDQAFNRRDLLVRRTDFYPMEVHWQPKSVSVARILETWNIGADSVVFIDDSPLELDEVKNSHPAIECIRFPKEDAAIYYLLYQLRDLFGKREVRYEDSLRAASIRQTPPALLRENFLESAEARLSFSYTKAPLDPRLLELINKTNQFNLNGRRYLTGEWQAYVEAADSIVLGAIYEDKYGPLGKISALGARLAGKSLLIDTWVMSCRAFSRRIEHHILRELFEHFQPEQIVLHFTATERNGPFRDFLHVLQPALGAQNPPALLSSPFHELFPRPSIQTV